MKLRNLIKISKNKIGKISLEVSLFLQTPKDYLYLFTYPTNKFVKFKPYSPSLQITADKIISMLNKAAPDLRIYFVGSASFHILRQGDIDLLAGSKYINFEKYLSILVKLFGEPSKRRRQFMEWHFTYNKKRVELLLANSSTSNFRNEIKLNKILKENKNLLKEYESIKKALNGLPVREYTKIRMVFFNRLLK